MESFSYVNAYITSYTCICRYWIQDCECTHTLLVTNIYRIFVWTTTLASLFNKNQYAAKILILKSTNLQTNI